MDADPACDRRLMIRLEILLNLLIRESCDEAAVEGAPWGGTRRPDSADAADPTEADPSAERAKADTPETDSNSAARSEADTPGTEAYAILRGAETHPTPPQTSACFSGSKHDPMVTPALRGWSRTSFLAPPKVADHWNAAVWVYHRPDPSAKDALHPGELLPAWAAITRFCANALEVWYNTDPETIPTQVDVHERDEYRCMIPGCGRRATLEGHHIEYGMEKKDNHLYNRLCLCNIHHKLLHAGIINITGRAPFPLYIRIGRPGSKSRLHYIGHRRIRVGPDGELRPGLPNDGIATGT
jgi:hypothetical protein